MCRISVVSRVKVYWLGCDEMVSEVNSFQRGLSTQAKSQSSPGTKPYQGLFAKHSSL